MPPSSSISSPRAGRAPDGGWGWVILAACFVNYLFLGIVFSAFPILYIALIEHFQSGRGVIGGIGSVYAFTGNFLGILTGVLVTKYGSRRVCMVGCIMVCGSHLLSSLLHSVPYLYITHGIIGGIGNGFVFLPTTVILQQYFDQKRGLAMGFGMSGLSIGGIVSSPLTNVLLNGYGLSGCYIMMAGLWLHTAVAICLFRPVSLEKYALRKAKERGREAVFNQDSIAEADSHHPTTNLQDNRDSRVEKTENGEPADKPPIDISLRKSPSATDEEQDKRTIPVTGSLGSTLVAEQPPKSRLHCGVLRVYETSLVKKKKCVDHLGFRLLRKPEFVLFLLGVFAVCFGFVSFLTHFLSRSIYIGLDRSLAITIQIAIDGCTTVGRYLFSAVVKIRCINNVIMYGTGIVSMSIIALTLPIARTFNVLLFYGMLQGLLMGGIFTTEHVVIVELTGIDQTEMAVGYFSMTVAMGCLLGIPVTGFIYDKSNSYDVLFYVVGTIEAIGAGFVFVAAYKAHNRN